MRIGIDARFLTHPQMGGFKTYTENLISALAEVDHENLYFLYLDRDPDTNTKLPDKPNFIPRVVKSSLPHVGVIWREQIRLPRQAKRDHLDLFHSPCLTSPLLIGCATVVTIHDMIWHFPGKFIGKNPAKKSPQRALQDWYYRLGPRFAARNAHTILTPSKAARNDIIDSLGIKPEKIFLTYEAASSIFRKVNDRQQIEDLRMRHNLSAHFMLALGSADPRKNIHSLLEAYALLPPADQSDCQLVIVWNSGFLAPSMKKEVEKLGLDNQVRFLEWVTTEDLVLLYNAASLFIFPSLYEGFGLPLLEAMACGTPVIAANNSSLPEIAGDAACFTDAGDASQMASMISNVLNDKALQNTLIARGFNRAASFSWENCALQTIEVYKQVAFARYLVIASVEGSKA
jgi:glycosyltransferase involved in cell wall biosynthesis